MNLHNLKPNTLRPKSQRIGRGGKRGTTSGRGTKGQKSRAGHKIRPAIRDLMMKIPKLRGFKFKSREVSFDIVDLNALENNFSSGEKVTPRTLKAKGLVDYGSGTMPRIKILNKGRVTKKLILENLSVSQKTASKILAAGGEVRQIR